MSPRFLNGAARLAAPSFLRLQSDERLTRLAQDGHDGALAVLCERYRPELLRYCSRLVGNDRAEDAVQQAFLNAYRSLARARSVEQIRPWLYRTAHNAALDLLRSSQQSVELDERSPAAGGVEEAAEAHALLREAFAAIARLPEPQRDALTLQAIEGRSHEEIAGALGVTTGAARQHLHRGRRTVRAAVTAITPYGIIARLTMAGTGNETAAVQLAGAGAGAGLGAVLGKVGVGVLAAGAVAGGATGQLPLVSEQSAKHPATAAAAHDGAAPGGEPEPGVAAAASTGAETPEEDAGERSTRRDPAREDWRERGRHGAGRADDDDNEDDRGSTEDRRREDDEREDDGRAQSEDRPEADEDGPEMEVDEDGPEPAQDEPEIDEDGPELDEDRSGTSGGTGATAAAQEYPEIDEDGPEIDEDGPELDEDRSGSGSGSIVEVEDPDDD